MKRDRERVREYSVREFCNILKANGFKYAYSTGGHDMYCRGKNKIPISVTHKVDINIARKLVNIYQLDICNK